MRLFTFIREFGAKFPGLLAANVALLFCVSAVEAAAIVSVIPVVDLLTGASPTRPTQVFIALTRDLGAGGGVKTALGFFLLSNALSSFFYVGARHLMLRAKYAVSRDLIVGMFSDFFHANWRFFSGSRQGTLLNTFTREGGVVGDAFGAIALFIASLLQAGLYLAVPLCLSWKVTLVAAGAAVLFVTPFLLAGKLAYQLGKLNASTAARLNELVHESLASAKLILGFGRRAQAVTAVSAAYEAHRAATLKSQTLTMALPFLYQPLGVAVMVITLIYSREAGEPLSVIAALLYSLLKIVPVIGRAAEQKNAVDNFFPSWEVVSAQRAQAVEHVQKSGGAAFAGFSKALEVRDVTFAHAGRQDSLSGVNITVAKGKMAAFVGESGAGKTTLADLLMGLHEPRSGQVLVDGRPLSSYDVDSYRERVGYVPQDSALFHATLRENLLWSKPDATEADVAQALSLAHCDEFVSQLPQGLETVVGDRGTRLSGGQVQRVALARAVIRKPELLVLDEATSSLDSHSEKLIQKALEGIAKETTVVVIAHRLSTIAKADVVYVLKDGRVVEQGS
jgi:ABC-type multidrug transport system fused ATPase/permease subunit